MLDRSEYMPLEYFKKQRWSGSYQGMRFLFQKQTEEETAYLVVTVWKEPYSFEATPEEKKTTERFGLDEEGRLQAIRWLEQQYEERQDEWKQAVRWDWEQENS